MHGPAAGPRVWWKIRAKCRPCSASASEYKGRAEDHSDAFAADPDRLARFEREAKVLASLNHPNIAQIHGLEDSGDIRALVLELVEGPTLADRIAKGPIPLDEVLPIATQIVEALEAAHQAGVIHRDLKPANIKVRDDGTVKVLDFGLAKALDASPTGDPSQSPTLTVAATQMGVIMGTAAYMSPEQARGKPLDGRADLWSFGVVLYEMLCGRHVFEGDDVSSTLAQVLEREPQWDALPSAVPSSVANLVSRCLQKDPRQRMQAAGDVRLALEGAFESPPAGAVHAGTAQLQLWQRPIPLAVAGTLLMLIGGIGRGLLLPDSPVAPRPVTRFAIELPANDGLFGNTLALSPDGTRLVYSANDQLYLRSMARMETSPIRGSESAASPFFSPDGEWIGFWQRSGLRKVAVAGGAPVTLGPSTNYWGASWSTDDSILLGAGPGGIARVSAEGDVTTLVAVEPGEEARDPQMLPGGRWVLFTVRPRGVTSWDDAQVVAQALETGERRVLIPGGRDARYVQTGHLLYIFGNTLFAVLFDIETMTVSSGGSPLIEGVGDSGRLSASFSVSDGGTLAFVESAGENRTRSALGWVGSDGEMTPLVERDGVFRAPRVDPDGERVIASLNAGSVDLWLYDIRRAALSRVTNTGVNAVPVWAPDGASITYASDRSGAFDLYRRDANGGGEFERLLETPSQTVPGSWSPDGQTLAFYEVTESGEDRDLWVLERDGQAAPFLATEFEEFAPMVSPVGQWVAYVSDHSGVSNVYVQPFPDGGPVTAISTDGGTEPVWSRDGTVLFFRDGARMMAVDVEDGTRFAVGPPRLLFERPYEQDPLGIGIQNYDVAADGRFLMVRRTADTTAITLVLNWFEELNRLAPTN